MAQPELSLTFTVGFAWWLRPYLNTLGFVSLCTRTEPDWEKLGRVVRRAVRLKVVRQPPGAPVAPAATPEWPTCADVVNASSVTFLRVEDSPAASVQSTPPSAWRPEAAASSEGSAPSVRSDLAEK